MRFTTEQHRLHQNLLQFYETWLEVSRDLARLPGGMYWKVQNSREYLYTHISTLGLKRVTSVGPKTPETEALYEEFTEKKTGLQERLDAIRRRINEVAPLIRALNLPAVDQTAGRILRALDTVGMLGGRVLVIGTYAISAYEVTARNRFAAGIDATEDLDFMLLLGAADAPMDKEFPRQLLLTMKQVDPSFLVSNSPKTIVTKSGYRVDLLMSHELAQRMEGSIPWKPQALKGQEWLTLGKPVRELVVDFEGWPVPVVAPDPRYFALHKLWLSEQPERIESGKAATDEAQGATVLGAIKAHMPHYPMDSAYISSLPAALKQYADREADARVAGDPE